MLLPLLKFAYMLIYTHTRMVYMYIYIHDIDVPHFVMGLLRNAAYLGQSREHAQGPPSTPAVQSQGHECCKLLVIVQCDCLTALLRAGFGLSKSSTHMIMSSRGMQRS